MSFFISDAYLFTDDIENQPLIDNSTSFGFLNILTVILHLKFRRVSSILLQANKLNDL